MHATCHLNLFFKIHIFDEELFMAKDIISVTCDMTICEL